MTVHPDDIAAIRSLGLLTTDEYTDSAIEEIITAIDAARAKRLPEEVTEIVADLTKAQLIEQSNHLYYENLCAPWNALVGVAHAADILIFNPFAQVDAANAKAKEAVVTDSAR